MASVDRVDVPPMMSSLPSPCRPSNLRLEGCSDDAPSGRGCLVYDERGSGTLSALVGVMVMLVTLFFVLQTALLLYTRSVVGAAAFEGARLVASGQRSETEASTTVQSLLRNLDPKVTWFGTDDAVRVTVSADAPSSPLLFVGGWSVHVSRSVSMRRERFR